MRYASPRSSRFLFRLYRESIGGGGSAGSSVNLRRRAAQRGPFGLCNAPVQLELEAARGVHQHVREQEEQVLLVVGPTHLVEHALADEAATRRHESDVAYVRAIRYHEKEKTRVL